MRDATLILILLLAGLGLADRSSAQAQTATSEMKPKQIAIAYVEPKNAALRPVYEEIRKVRALEKIRDLLSPFRLPRPLTIRTEDCDGTSNAWYEDDAVTVCYEFLDDIWKNAPASDAGGIAPVDALIGPTVDVFLHEAGHALFDYWQTPIFGREEDAADQFSTFLMLQADKADARRLILGNAYQYKGDLRAPALVRSLRHFSDVHGTPSQRYYNVLCIAYGADPDLFADFVTGGRLPKDRAEGCEFEYKQVVNAFNKLVTPYIDENVRKDMHVSWLPPADTTPVRRSDKSGWRRLLRRN
jgi:hypothetical protein